MTNGCCNQSDSDCSAASVAPVSLKHSSYPRQRFQSSKGRTEDQKPLYGYPDALKAAAPLTRDQQRARAPTAVTPTSAEMPQDSTTKDLMTPSAAVALAASGGPVTESIATGAVHSKASAAAEAAVHAAEADTPPSTPIAAVAEESAMLEVSPRPAHYKTGPVQLLAPPPPAAVRQDGKISSSIAPQSLSHLLQSKNPAARHASDTYSIIPPTAAAPYTHPLAAAAVDASAAAPRVQNSAWPAVHSATPQQQQMYSTRAQAADPAPPVRPEDIDFPFAPVFPGASKPPAQTLTQLLPAPASTAYLTAPVASAPWSPAALYHSTAYDSHDVGVGYNYSTALPPDRLHSSLGCDQDAARIIADLEQLQTVYRTLSNCVKCGAAARSVVLMPCKHLALCEGCSIVMQANGDSEYAQATGAGRAVAHQPEDAGGYSTGAATANADGGGNRNVSVAGGRYCPMCGVLVERCISGVTLPGVCN